MVIDESGDDQYFCQLESQGLGATLGVGVLIDKAGRDRYHAYDNENGRRITMPSSQTKRMKYRCRRAVAMDAGPMNWTVTIWPAAWASDQRRWG